MSYILIVPGLGGSGPEHWQSHWENNLPNCRRVSGCNWNIPDRDEWISALDLAIREAPEPPILVAHSLGCAMVAHWAAHHKSTPVRAIMMVAPADVDERQTIPAEALTFSPMPMSPLPAPSLVVASGNDSFVTLDRAHAFALAWGSGFENLGNAGHINADAHLGLWEAGQTMLASLLEVQAEAALA